MGHSSSVRLDIYVVLTDYPFINLGALWAMSLTWMTEYNTVESQVRNQSAVDQLISFLSGSVTEMCLKGIRHLKAGIEVTRNKSEIKAIEIICFWSQV